MKTLYSRIGRENLLQLLKYYAAGIAVNAGGYLLFLMLLQGGMGHKLAATLLYFIGVLTSFWLNRKLVFDSAVRLHSSLARMALMMLAGYMLNILILYLFVDKNGFNPGAVQFFSIFLVSVFFYLANKFYVHRKH